MSLVSVLPVKVKGDLQKENLELNHAKKKAQVCHRDGSEDSL